MTDEQFSERAYSWRGRTVIKRNLEILEEKDVSSFKRMVPKR